MKKSLLALLLVVMVVALGACGAKAPADVTGTYTGNMQVEGMEDAMASLEGVEGVDTSALTALTAMSVTLKEGNAFTITAAGQDMEGTYKLDGTKLTLTIDGADQEAKLEKDTITMDMEGVSVELKKQ